MGHLHPERSNPVLARPGRSGSGRRWTSTRGSTDPDRTRSAPMRHFVHPPATRQPPRRASTMPAACCPQATSGKTETTSEAGDRGRTCCRRDRRLHRGLQFGRQHARTPHRQVPQSSSRPSRADPKLPLSTRRWHRCQNVRMDPGYSEPFHSRCPRHIENRSDSIAFKIAATLTTTCSRRTRRFVDRPLSSDVTMAPTSGPESRSERGPTIVQCEESTCSIRRPVAPERCRAR